MELNEILQKAISSGASDIFLIPGAPVEIKVQGAVSPLTDQRLMPKQSEEILHEIYGYANRTLDALDRDGDDDFSFALANKGRFRCNAYRQRGTLAMTLRIVTFGLPDPTERQIPDKVMDLANYRSGMVLVTGPAGSGKSTTLACLVDKINSTRTGHIICIEDPIEYIHPHKKSLVSQREIPADAPNFSRALRSALRQAPDVILLGEMRDLDTIHTAITAAETGHLVLSSLHTIGASKTVDRIVDMFPGEQQQQIRVQLSMVLKAVVSQRLIPTLKGKLAPVFEVMTITPAIATMIRDGRTHQIDNAITTGGDAMMGMDAGLMRLVKEGLIKQETALAYAVNPDALRKRI